MIITDRGKKFDVRILVLLLPADIAFTYLGNSTYLPGDPYWIVWPANGLLFGFLAVIPRRS